MAGGRFVESAVVSGSGRDGVGAGPLDALSRTRRRIDVETHVAVFTWVLERLAEAGLVKGKTVGVDATTLEANAAMRSIERRDTGESYEAFVRRLAEASGIEMPTRAELARFDRSRKNKKTSNEQWQSPQDPDAKVRPRRGLVLDQFRLTCRGHMNDDTLPADDRPQSPDVASEGVPAHSSEPLSRPKVPALDLILGKPFPVLDSGFVRVIDYLGDDCSVVQAARVSYPADRMKVDGENRFAEGQETSKADGGLIRTNLDYNIALNKDSSLRREWVAVHDNLPLMIVGTPGVTTVYKSGTKYSQGEYNYAAKATLIANSDQAVTAFEVRFVSIDVFGERMTTLAATEIQDIAAGEKKTFDWKWNASRERDAARYFASIAFIAKARTADGQVHFASNDVVLDAVRRFAKDATEADLDPSSDKP